MNEETMKHTKEKWTLGESRKTEKGLTAVYVETEGEFRGSICSMQSAEHINGITGEEMLANAQLIVASKDLLDACSVALGHLTGGMDGDYRDCDPVAVLRVAIAKAIGKL